MIGPLAIASVTPGPSSRITLAEPAPSTPQGSLTVTGTGIEGADGGPPLDGVYAVATWLSDTKLVVGNGKTQGTYSGNGTVTIRKPYTAAIAAVSAGPGSTVTTQGPHFFAAEDDVTIHGTGVAGVDSPQSGGWQSASIASISPGPSSVVTLAEPRTIPSNATIAVQDAAAPAGTPQVVTMPDGSTITVTVPGVAIASVTAGPKSIITTSAPHGLDVGDPAIVSGVGAGVDSPFQPPPPGSTLPGPPIPWTVSEVLSPTIFRIPNGASAAFGAGGLASTIMQGVGGSYAPGQWEQLSPTSVRISNGATSGESHEGAAVSWLEPLVTTPWKIDVTGPDTFTIPNGPGMGAGSGGFAVDSGP